MYYVHPIAQLANTSYINHTVPLLPQLVTREREKSATNVKRIPTKIEKELSCNKKKSTIRINITKLAHLSVSINV